MKQYRIRFGGPPGPEAGRFIELEDEMGASISTGQWSQDGDYWIMTLPAPDPDTTRTDIPELVAEIERQRGEIEILREALRAIADYVAVNEMSEAPRLPLAPERMKRIARAALEATGKDGEVSG